MDRHPADGLTQAEVAQRRRDGLVNRVELPASRTAAEIVRANVLTRFNALLGGLGALVLVVGAWQDALFLVVIVINALVGVVQELRAKRTLDRLALLSAGSVTVRRDGRDVAVPVADVVLDDLVVLGPGDQVPADGTVVHSADAELDESLLTGESEPLVKAVGDRVMSGSFVVAGRCEVVATGVGAASYANQLAAEAKRFSLVRSELVSGTNRLLGWISWAIAVIGPLLVLSQLLQGDDWRVAVTGAVAGMVGMIPEGLVLLTTLAFFVAVMGLARRQVLVQELPAVEVLARVDVVCLDKTGTITDGHIRLTGVEVVEGVERDLVMEALGALADDPSPNATAAALAAQIAAPEGWRRTADVPFSSARKWSAATFDGRGTWVMGAPEIVLGAGDASAAVRRRVDAIAAQGTRVIVVGRAGAEPIDADRLPPVEPAALVTLAEQIRPDAPEMLEFFARQGVTLKVISGDHPRTVGAVARAAGVPGADQPDAAVDARTLPDDAGGLADAVERHVVFGRVTPQQKRAMVTALRAKGHVVAMTGDGVNDALALKEADLGVAMGSGAAATRAVAQLVLLDGQFSRMPLVLAEGRRVIANIERVARLFVSKNVMAALLSLLVVVASLPYPFLPRHLTVFSALTIGIPAFLLALAPNPRRYVPGFLFRVVRFSAPVGTILALGVFAAYGFARWADADPDEARTGALIAAMLMGLAQLVMVSRPVRGWKLALVLVMGGVFAALLAVPAARDFLELQLVVDVVIAAVVLGVAGAALVVVVGVVVDRRDGRTVREAIGPVTTDPGPHRSPV
jgi:cation-transporting ATPase E